MFPTYNPTRVGTPAVFFPFFGLSNLKTFYVVLVHIQESVEFTPKFTFCGRWSRLRINLLLSGREGVGGPSKEKRFRLH